MVFSNRSWERYERYKGKSKGSGVPPGQWPHGASSGKMSMKSDAPKQGCVRGGEVASLRAQNGEFLFRGACMQRFCFSRGHSTSQNFTQVLNFQAVPNPKEAPPSSYYETMASSGEEPHITGLRKADSRRQSQAWDPEAVWPTVSGSVETERRRNSVH